MPLDIFVPYWGDPAMLKETVASVFAQTNGDWVLTVIDDCYPDPTVKEYFATIDDERVSYQRNESNKGITENYRTCVSQATQDLMVILGCDDVLLPNYVDVVLQAHRDFPDASVIQPGVQVIDETGQIVRSLADSVKRKFVGPRTNATTVLAGESLAVSLLGGNWLYWPSLAFRTDAIRKVSFRDGLPIVQDLALVMDIVLQGGSLVHVPTLAFSYRRHSASASAATLTDGTRFAGDREYAQIAEDLCRAKGWKKAAVAARVRWTSRLHAVTLVPGALLSRNPKAVKATFRHAFGH
ncbi:glycosyltransferase family 2 protein [Pseudarthrobacter sp. DSP2-3-2b1]|uniref:glycosyltransferase family 2 protein n=1 Tax=Pseudarthrobacter sp. DSP2-3-2b1 TaxID=2804661 RepID=UPI003CF3A2D1